MTRRRGPLHAARWWLALLACGLSACATTAASGVEAPVDLASRCDGGDLSACEAWGAQLLGEGRREEAAAAYGRVCQKDYMPACLTEGRLRMEQGDLDGAEPPLRKTYDANVEEGALALADLHAARGDEMGAARLRENALSIDKSVVEVVLGYRFAMVGDGGVALDINVQPMAFLARRLNVGVNMTLSTAHASRGELNGYAGYQHFLTNWAAPYARLLTGAQLNSRGARFNIGAEAGMKLFAGAFAHLGVGVGTSFVGATYTSVELGVDWVVALMILANLR
ncbi:hypothetical protein [Pyxidicoccus sp. MSG2]|uniref:hypothetical protein n=1 Tax=Pyxidicoccus sp. MSG2 TaxID=2996790 RepID=UPI00226F8D6D|nr:hypothetical protein [Pyxidicoccus sp. MSG2]MCY1015784.1 hypothetical protein [Pyxidicoccus sp. MSG2]